MNKSAPASSYVNLPPNIPYFLFKTHVSAIEQVIAWAEKEFQDRLIFCAERGYWKALKYYNEEYSPIRILAEMHGFRKICSLIPKSTWDRLTGRQRVFIRRAYELRESLMS